MSNLLVNY